MFGSAEARECDVQIAGELEHPRLDALEGAAGLYQSPGWLRACAEMCPGPSRYAVAADGVAAVFVVEEPAAGRYGPGFVLTPTEAAALGAAEAAPVALFLGRAGYSSDLSLRRGAAGEVSRSLLSALSAEAIALGAGVGVLPFLPPPAAQRLVEAGVVEADELVLMDAAAVVDLPALGSFPGGLKPSRRGVVRRDMRRYEASGFDTRREDLHSAMGYAPRLLAAVVDHHGGDLAEATLSRALRAQAKHLGPCSRVVASTDAAGAVVAYSLSFVYGAGLFVRLVGLEYAPAEAAGAYFHVAYSEPIRWSLTQGLETVDLGIGTLHPKVLRGARLEPRYGVFRGPRGQRLGPGAALAASRRTLERLDHEVGSLTEVGEGLLYSP